MTLKTFVLSVISGVIACAAWSLIQWLWYSRVNK